MDNLPKTITFLGIETSCDETAASVVQFSNHGSSSANIFSNIVFSQIDTHAPYGGVVPELAARQHLPLISGIIREAIATSGLSPQDFDGIAATAGPGLIGGVMIGLTTGKALASAWEKPFLPINHLEAHALTARMSEDVTFPYLLLLVSGGHCQLISVLGLGQYELLGQTLDDAVGEAFDKTAKFLGLPYPGGPQVEAAARLGDPSRFNLPRPMFGQNNLDFSFSGLKTALQQAAEKAAPLTQNDINDLCAGVQDSIIACLADRTGRAMQAFRSRHGSHKQFVVAGGVAANMAIRAQLSELAMQHDMELKVAPMALCTDNAAMVAWVGCEYMRAGKMPEQNEALKHEARARWPLDRL